MGRTETRVVVEGRELVLSNLDKVMYPRTGFTKGDVIAYYRAISPWLLPHLAARPVTLKRYPDGVEGEFFYEKTCPPHRPEWVRIAPIWSEGRGEDIPFCVFDDLPTLVWAANLADLELHTYLHSMEDDERPHFLAFDLDPGPPANVLDAARVALALRALLAHLNLEAYPKTSGGKGMQVYVPLNAPDVTYEHAKPFARAVAEILAKERPREIVSNMRKDLRKGKVLVDWSQNDDHKTTVCVYSLRARERPTVSTPLFWDEVEDAVRAERADRLVFLSDDALSRCREHGDLFAPVLSKRQALPPFVRQSSSRGRQEPSAA
ncbi:MAG TPA: non-homologous end-joining DNA ligase [Candidatus Thermoplasmatota archaeon]|nr:non-homologous end-joining DNA ligase [Candidatus Thermoplasmatota archaeon]